MAQGHGYSRLIKRAIRIIRHISTLESLTYQPRKVFRRVGGLPSP